MQTSWFKARMDDRELRQTDLAEALNLDRSQISRIINGTQDLKLREIEPLAEVLGVSPLEVLLRAWFWTEAEMTGLLESWSKIPQARRRQIQRIIDASIDDEGEPPAKRGRG